MLLNFSRHNQCLSVSSLALDGDVGKLFALFGASLVHENYILLDFILHCGTLGLPDVTTTENRSEVYFLRGARSELSTGRNIL